MGAFAVFASAVFWRKPLKNWFSSSVVRFFPLAGKIKNAPPLHKPNPSRLPYSNSAGMGLPGRSSSQTMERIHQRLPSKYN